MRTTEMHIRLFRGMGWGLIGTIANQGSAVLIALVVSNLLGIEGYGNYAIVASTITSLAMIGTFGLGTSATRYVAELRSAAPDRAGHVITLALCTCIVTGGVTAIVFALFGRYVAVEWFSIARLSRTFAIAALVIPFAVISGVANGILAGLEAYREVSRGCLVAGASNTACAALGGSLAGIDGVVAGLACGALAQCMWLIRGLRCHLAKHGIAWLAAGFWAEKSILTGYALPAALSGCTTLPAIWLANSIILRGTGGVAELALASSALMAKTVILYVPVLMNGVNMAILSHSMRVKETGVYASVFWFNIVVTTTSILALVSIGLVFSSEILGLFGTAFSSGGPALHLMLIASVPEAIAISCYQLVQARSRMWLSLLIIAAPRDAALVVGTYMMKDMGAVGMATAFIVSQCVSLFGTVAAVVYIGVPRANLIEFGRFLKTS